MAEFRMPMLGADMEAGTLIEWVKRPGDRVRRGDIIAVVDTQKGAIDVEVFEDGVIERTLVDPGAAVPVGTVLAMIGTGPGVSAVPEPAPAVSPAAAVAAVPPPDAAAVAAAPHEVGRPTGRPRVSPAARQAARRLAVDLGALTGTGAGGAVTVADVERAASATPSASPPAEGEGRPAPAPPAGMRSAIAAAMSRSKREIPHFYLETLIDMSAAEAWLAAENARRPMGERLLPVALLVKAVAHALADVPELAGFWTDGAFRPAAGVHIGCAVALRGGGLVAPALHDVDKKTTTAVMIELRDLVVRARAGALRSSELADPVITVTNLGDLGVDATFGIVFPPQVALVGFGRIARRPWAVGDAVAVRPVMTATLSADHRVVDGHRGGLFLAAVDRWLQRPEGW